MHVEYRRESYINRRVKNVRTQYIPSLDVIVTILLDDTGQMMLKTVGDFIFAAIQYPNCKGIRWVNVDILQKKKQND